MGEVVEETQRSCCEGRGGGRGGGDSTTAGRLTPAIPDATNEIKPKQLNNFPKQLVRNTDNN